MTPNLWALWARLFHATTHHHPPTPPTTTHHNPAQSNGGKNKLRQVCTLYENSIS